MQYILLSRDDIDKIRSFDQTHAPLLPVYHTDTEEELTTFFKDKTFICYGLLKDKQFIGHCSYMKDKGCTYYLNAISIHRDQRRRGIASSVFNKVKQEIVDKGGKVIFLTVAPQNAPAVKFYEKHGFQTYNVKKNVYGPDADRLYMKLILK